MIYSYSNHKLLYSIQDEVQIQILFYYLIYLGKFKIQSYIMLFFVFCTHLICVKSGTDSRKRCTEESGQSSPHTHTVALNRY